MLYKDMNKVQEINGLKDITNAHDIDAINNSIRNILLTRIGSVPGKPYFGSMLDRLVFEQMDYMTERMAIRYTREALNLFEDRILITDISVKFVEAYNRVVIIIEYEFKDGIGRMQSAKAQIAYNL